MNGGLFSYHLVDAVRRRCPADRTGLLLSTPALSHVGQGTA